MLRRADEREHSTFLLVEHTIRQTRPRMGNRGLESAIVSEGTIARGSLGRLRLHFTGQDSDVEPENRVRSRPLSGEEAACWAGLQRLVDSVRPIVDPQWNLVSMRIGSRVLSRLPLGGVVTFEPNHTASPASASGAPRGAVNRRPDGTPASRRRDEAVLLTAIDAFLREGDGFSRARSRVTIGWNQGRAASLWDGGGASSPFSRNQARARSKWHKCPICRMPVAKGRFNPRIPVGSVRPGIGGVRDLHGGYLSRLRETYLLEDPVSLIHSHPALPQAVPETSVDHGPENGTQSPPTREGLR